MCTAVRDVTVATCVEQRYVTPRAARWREKKGVDGITVAAQIMIRKRSFCGDRLKGGASEIRGIVGIPLPLLRGTGSSCCAEGTLQTSTARCSRDAAL